VTHPKQQKSFYQEKLTEEIDCKVALAHVKGQKVHCACPVPRDL